MAADESESTPALEWAEEVGAGLEHMIELLGGRPVMKIKITYLHDAPTGRWTAVTKPPHAAVTEGATIREARERMLEALSLDPEIDCHSVILTEIVGPDAP